MIKLIPIDRLTITSGLYAAQPAPALMNVGIWAVVGGIEDLEESLSAAFVIHYGAITFRKAGSREQHISARRSGCELVIDNQ